MNTDFMPYIFTLSLFTLCYVFRYIASSVPGCSYYDIIKITECGLSGRCAVPLSSTNIGFKIAPSPGQGCSDVVMDPCLSPFS